VQPVPEAAFLDIILYSREQLLQEYAAMPTRAASSKAAAAGGGGGGGGSEQQQGAEAVLPDVPWGIIRWGALCGRGARETPLQLSA
jgi:hypothetical protein